MIVIGKRWEAKANTQELFLRVKKSISDFNLMKYTEVLRPATGIVFAVIKHFFLHNDETALLR